MRKTKLKLFLILFLILTLISGVVFATDATITSTADEDTTNLEEPEIIKTDKVYKGEDVTIDTLIDGNVVAVGRNITLTGGIARDLYVIAENFVMDKESVVYGNLFVLASNVTINGGIYEIYGACDTFKLEYYGETQTDLKIMAKETTINGVVRRNAYIDTDKLVLDSYGEIQGDLTYTSKSEVVYREVVTADNDEDLSTNETTDIPEKAVVGKKEFNKRDKKTYKSDKQIKNAVEKVLKDTKDMDEEKLKSAIMTNIFENINVKANNDKLKGNSNTMKIPSIVVYIDIAVIILLVLALVLPKIKKTKPTE